MKIKSKLLTSSIAFLLGLNGALFIAPVASYAGNKFHLSQSQQSDNREGLLKQEKNLVERIRELGANGKYPEQIPLQERLLDIRKKIYGTEHPNVIKTLNDLGLLYSIEKRYDKAESIYLQLLAINKKLFGPEDPNIISTLSYLGTSYFAQGKYDQAIAVNKKVLAIYKKIKGADSSEVALTLNSLALLSSTQGRYSEAEAIYQQVLAINKKIKGTDSYEVVWSLISLGTLYQTQGKFEQAESILKQAVAINKKLPNTEPQLAIMSLSYLAQFYKFQGRYLETEPLYQQALEILQKLGANQIFFAPIWYDLGELYQLQGRYQKAESLYQKALEINKQYFSSEENSRIYFNETVHNLARLYQAWGKYDKAESLYQEALAVYKKFFGTPGTQTTPFTSLLNNLASLYIDREKYSEAEPLLKQALATDKKNSEIYNQNLTNLPITLYNLARLYQGQGKYSEAEPLYQQALAIGNKLLRKEHPYMATGLNSLAQLYAIQGKNDRALKAYARVLEIEESNLKSNLIAGSELQKQQYMNLFFKTTNQIISLHLQNLGDNSEAAKLAFTAILQRKGRILDFVTNTQEIIGKELDPETGELFNKLIRVRTALANLVYKPPEKINPQNYAQQLNLLQKKAEQLEDQISRRSAAWQNRFQPVTINSVRKLIPADAVLVEFIKYYPSNFQTGKRKPEARYAAYILTANAQLKGIDLGQADRIEQSLSKFRKNLQNRDTWEDSDSLIAAAKQLESLIWQPLQSAIANQKHILISPDSSLNLIPFEALIDRNGRYLVENKKFTYLASGRELLRLDRNNSAANPPVVLGDPDFDSKGQIAALQRNTTRSLNFSASIAFGRLPATEIEAAKIKQIFPQFQIFTRDRATEQLIKQLERPKILHLATHGFFLPADSNNSNLTATTSNSLGLTNNNPTQNNPIELSWLESSLLRSGIVFAGTNIRSSAGEDGILTALEATNLNLRGTELVVLSACDTGLGEVSVGEGVYGLRRALAIAGSQSQMMSLWKVEDEATQKLMVDYYQKLKNQLGRGEALRQVQLEMINNSQYNHPYYWASFIFSGDWTALN